MRSITIGVVVVLAMLLGGALSAMAWTMFIRLVAESC